MGQCFSKNLGKPIELLEKRNYEKLKNVKVPIIFLIGGPGIGKTTVGNSLASRYGFVLISTTQMLREEVDKADSERANLIKNMMERGRNLPADVIIQLILNKMISRSSRTGYLLIGFPREKRQALMFNSMVRRPDLVIFLTSRKIILEDRMQERAHRNERFDDTPDGIRERLKTYYKNIDSTLAPYKNVTVQVNGTMITDVVLTEICKVIDGMLVNKKGYHHPSITKSPQNL